jgi:amino acid permease
MNIIASIFGFIVLLFISWGLFYMLLSGLSSLHNKPNETANSLLAFGLGLSFCIFCLTCS